MNRFHERLKTSPLACVAVWLARSAGDNLHAKNKLIVIAGNRPPTDNARAVHQDRINWKGKTRCLGFRDRGPGLKRTVSVAPVCRTSASILGGLAQNNPPTKLHFSAFT